MKNILITVLVFLTAQAFSQKLGISGGMLTYYRITANDTIKEHYPISACNIDYQKSQNDIQIFYNTGFAPRKVYGGKWNSTVNGDINDFIDAFTDGAGGGGGTAEPERDIYADFSRYRMDSDSLQVDISAWNPTLNSYEITSTNYLDDVFNAAAAPSSGTYFEITYADLTNAIDNQTLIPGATYLLTDYKTTFNLPVWGAYNDANTEILALKATSIQTLAPIAYSPSYPEDIIYYQRANETYISGSTTGQIIRRIDTKRNINVPFDFRAYRIENDIPNFPAFDPGASYNYHDIVTYSGYVCICHTPAPTGATPDPAYFNWWGEIAKTKQINMNSGNFSWTPGSNANGIGMAGSYSSPLPLFDPSNSRNFVITGQPEYITDCSFYSESGTITDCTFESLQNVYFGQETRDNKGGKIKNTCFGREFIGNRFTEIERCLLSYEFKHNVIGDDFLNNAMGNTLENHFERNFQYNIAQPGLNYSRLASGCTNNHFGQNFENNTLHRAMIQSFPPDNFRNVTIYPALTAEDFTGWGGISTTPGAQTTFQIWEEDTGVLFICYLNTAAITCIGL